MDSGKNRAPKPYVVSSEEWPQFKYIVFNADLHIYKSYDDVHNRKTFYDILHLPISARDAFIGPWEFCSLELSEKTPLIISKNCPTAVQPQTLYLRLIIPTQQLNSTKEIKKVLSDFCLLLNYSLSKQTVFNTRFSNGGLVNIGFNWNTDVHLYGGDSEDGDFPASIQSADEFSPDTVCSASLPQVNATLLCFSNQASSLSHMKAFMKASNFFDPIAKYTLLFGFFEKLYKSKKFSEKEKEVREEKHPRQIPAKDEALLRTLQNWSVRSFVLEGMRRDITREILGTIRATRNIIFHQTDLVFIEKILYCYLMPITFEIMESYQNNTEMFERDESKKNEFQREYDLVKEHAEMLKPPFSIFPFDEEEIVED